MIDDLDLVLGVLIDVLLTPLNVHSMTSQPSIVTVKLLLDNAVPLPQAANKSLVVVD